MSCTEMIDLSRLGKKNTFESATINEIEDFLGIGSSEFGELPQSWINHVLSSSHAIHQLAISENKIPKATMLELIGL